MGEKLILATRGSALALAQSHWVRDELCRVHPGLEVELLLVKTTGDKILDVPLSKIGGKGLFTKEIEETLLQGQAHFAVHSLKDLPTTMPEGLALTAMTNRVDPRDVLIGRTGETLDDLPLNAVVGTSSLRRCGQLAHYRPNLQFAPIRGNVETRLKKLHSENLDAIVLAAAGLLRLDLEHHVTQWLPPEISLPAAGQGIIGIETRTTDDATNALLAAINSPISQVCALAERSALACLGGGCQTPIGLLAQVEDDTCTLQGMVTHPTGTPYFRATLTGKITDAETLGKTLAQNLLMQGAKAFISQG